MWPQTFVNLKMFLVSKTLANTEFMSIVDHARSLIATITVSLQTRATNSSRKRPDFVVIL